MKNEKGAVMLEGMIIVVLTTFILIWLLALGFLNYQCGLLRAITNNAAVKVGFTYNNPTSDIIMGYVEAEELSKRKLYGNFYDSELLSINTARAEDYVSYRMKKSNFAGTIKDLNVTLAVDADNMTHTLTRGHVTLRAECTFKTPFGEIFELFGMNRYFTYTCTAYAERVDLIDYIDTTDFVKNAGSFNESKAAALINSIFKRFNSHRYEKN